MKKTVSADNLPKALGPYSHGVVFGNMMYTSGQMGAGSDGNLIGGVAEQTARCLRNVKSVLEAGGFSMGNVVKTMVFTTLPIEKPPASKTDFTFLRHRAVCSATPPIKFPSLPAPICPLVYIILPKTTPWLYGPNALGKLSALTVFFISVPP